jgi:dihydrofolate reductase
MGKIVISEYVSLDGVMENPGWTMPYWNDEIAKFKFNELFESDALLLGRVTYQGFASAWPSRTDEQGFADRMNNIPKYVVSTTLDKGEWNNTHLIKENLAEEVSRLKKQPGQNILIYGSGTLVNTLMLDNLIDEYRLLVYPLVLGSGKTLFQGLSKPTNLKLSATHTLQKDVILLKYEPERK